MHIFDTHLPYLGFETLDETQEIQVDITDRFKEEYINTQPLNYEELMAYASDIESPKYIDELQQYYRESMVNVAASLEKFVHMPDHHGKLNDAMIIIAGDHGEEFVEDGIAGHATLRETNIRPRMLIKPPQDEEFFVPDKADLIDIFPTISDYVAGEIPDQCAGESWLQMDSDSSALRPASVRSCWSSTSGRSSAP
jgi:arylsulfatase A-like enzyme